VTVEALTKFVPVTVIVTGVEVPAVAEPGETEVTVGAATVKFRLFEETRLIESVTSTVAVPATVKRLAATVAVMDVEEFAVMLSGVATPLNVQLTMVDTTGKLVPVKVRVKLACPWEADVWLRLDRTGIGAMVKVCVPGAGTEPVVTPTCALPAVARSEAGTLAVNWVALTKVVVNEVGELPQELHHVTVDEPLTKLEPLTVRVTALVVPATAWVGEIEVTPEAAMVKVRVFDGTWLTASVTRTVADPAETNRDAGTVTVMETEELWDTVSGVVVLPAVQFTMGDAGKLVPVSVRLRLPWPAVAVEGVSELRTGLGEMVKVCVEGPAPVPLVTPTCTVPAVVRSPDGTTAMSWVALT
jgi:hypothetical protein